MVTKLLRALILILVRRAFPSVTNTSYGAAGRSDAPLRTTNTPYDASRGGHRPAHTPSPPHTPASHHRVLQTYPTTRLLPSWRQRLHTPTQHAGRVGRRAMPRAPPTRNPLIHLDPPAQPSPAGYRPLWRCLREWRRPLGRSRAAARAAAAATAHRPLFDTQRALRAVLKSRTLTTVLR